MRFNIWAQTCLYKLLIIFMNVMCLLKSNQIFLIIIIIYYTEIHINYKPFEIIYEQCSSPCSFNAFKFTWYGYKMKNVLPLEYFILFSSIFIYFACAKTCKNVCIYTIICLNFCFKTFIDICAFFFLS